MRLLLALFFIFTFLLNPMGSPLRGERVQSDLFVNPIPGLPEGFIRGVDLSEVPWILEMGGRFYDSDGVERDVLEILKDSGVNWVRLRVWNNPYGVDGTPLGGGNCDLRRMARFAAKAKARGFKLLINLQYSDWWADPGKQSKPREWVNLTYGELVEAVYSWTRGVLEHMASNGASPDMVQVGNEVDNGFLWPEGRVENWGQFVTLLKSGVEAVKGFNPGVEVMIHLSGQHEPQHYVSFFNKLLESGVDFDVIGLSFYTYMHGSLEKLGRIVKALATGFNKTVVVVETAYAWTLLDADGYPNVFGEEWMEVKGGYLATVQGQASLVRDVAETLFSNAGEEAGGLFYWGAAWIPVEGAGWRTGEGNPWENQALFDFNGRALPSLRVFKLIYGGGAPVEPRPLRLYGRKPLFTSIKVGETPKLPGEVLAVYSDHSLRSVKVDWGPVAPLNEAGLRRVYGLTPGFELTVEALVAVVEPATVETLDPLFDDKGPGTYGYPRNPVFKPGVFDISRAVFRVAEDGFVVRVYLRDVGGNPWNAPNGFSLQFIHVYVRTSDPEATGGVFKAETYGLNIAFRPDYAWQYAILLTPGWGREPLPGGGLSTIVTSSGGVYVEDLDFDVSANHVENYVEARIPLWVLEDWENLGSWRIVVAATCWDGFSPGKVREVKPGGGEWVVDATAYADGGAVDTLIEAYEAGVLPKLLDLLVYSDHHPRGVEADEQYGWLMGFNAAERRLASVPAVIEGGLRSVADETGGLPRRQRGKENTHWLVATISIASIALTTYILVKKGKNKTFNPPTVFH